ncbi:hypothetical protein SDC9_145586 [bioreactor metagenome]|uniref:Uncharacterized protein n=1 Tax=bioreactor metagenome TaxID=1076179 RepID=A0A645E9C2_9ZZZZ
MAAQGRELVGVGLGNDHVAHLAAVEAVLQVVGGEQHGGGDHHGAELDAAEHQLPQRQFVAEHEQHAVAALDAHVAQPVGDLRGALAHLAKAALDFAAVLFDDVQRRGLVTARHVVEVVQRPVEFAQLRPAEILVGIFIVAAVLLQKVARGEEGIARLLGADAGVGRVGSGHVRVSL